MMDDAGLEALQARGSELVATARADARPTLEAALDLLQHDWVLDYQGYDEWLLAAGEALDELKLPVAAAFTYLARGDRAATLRLLLAQRAPLARAFVLERSDPRAAAELYQSKGCFARAAVAWERTREADECLDAWRTAVSAYAGGAPIDHGLAQLGLAGALARSGAQPGEVNAAVDVGLAIVASDAVEVESVGDHTTALEHYQTIRAVGTRLGQVEHLLEGAVNEARLYETLGDLFGAFTTRVHAARVATDHGEYRAGAVLFQEAAATAQSVRPSGVKACWTRAAAAWSAAAERVADGSPKLAENALLGRLDALNRAGDQAGVFETYRALAALRLNAPLRDRYLALAEQQERSAFAVSSQDESSHALPAAPVSTRHWAAGLLAREMGRDPADALVECTAMADSIIGRRRATMALIRLYAFPDTLDTRVVAATTLGPNEGVASTELALLDYAAAPEPAVRAAALRGLARRRGTRVSMALVNGLADPESEVRFTALECLGAVERPEAVGPAIRMAVQGGPDAALAAVRWLAGLSEADALDPLFRVSKGAAAPVVRAEALRHFELRCPAALRDAYG